MIIPRSRLRPARAFTLLEVLLATLVSAMLLGALTGIFYTGMRVRNVVTAAVERDEPLERTAGIIRQDLANLVLPGGMMSGTLQTSPLQVAGQSTTASTGPSTPQLSALLSQNPAGVPGRSSPLFYVSVGHVDETSPYGDVEQIYYFLAPSTNGMPGNDLYRAVTRNLLPVVSEDPVRQYLMSGVESVNFYFYSPGITQAGQWLDYWDSTNPDPMTLQTNNVPQAIKVDIQLLNANRLAAQGAPVELVVPVMVQASTNQASSTLGGIP